MMLPRRLWLLPTCAFLLCVGLGQRASAATISYEFRICESLSVLTDPNNLALQLQSVQTNQQLLSLARDMPYFQLLNTSTDASAELTTFRLTIPDDRPNTFDYASLIAVSPGMTFSLNQPDAVNGGLTSKFIDISFSGFTQGKSIIFRSDIDRTIGDPTLLTDYRTVLFSANSSGSTDNNATVQVGFNDNPALTTSMHLPNFTTNGAVLTCICFRDPALVDHVQPFLVGQAIPEPGTYAACAAMLAGFCWRWRKRKIS